MRKPELSDFGLSESIVEKHSRDIREYEELRKTLTARADSFNETIALFMGVLVTVLFFIFGGVLASVEDAGITLLVSWVIHAIILSILIAFTEENSNIFSSIVSSLVMSTVFPFISLGVFSYLCLKRDDEYIEKKYPKSNYVSTDVANRLIDYRAAMKEYEQYTERLKESLERAQKESWLNMSGYQFKNEIAALYERQGYSVARPSRGSDVGADLILKKDNVRIAVQCRHRQTHVGINDVRALMGVVAGQQFDCGIFVSISGFTASVYEETKTSRVLITLISLDDILMMSYRSNELNADTSYESKNAKRLQSPKVKSPVAVKRVCTGNCSTCNRDVCIEDN